MSLGFNTVQVHVNGQALRKNLQVIRQYASCPAPVIKSDAYGHGMQEVSSLLHREGIRHMAAGAVGEAVALKERWTDVEVLSLLGPLAVEDYTAIVDTGIIPFVSNFGQLRLLEEAGQRAQRSAHIALKFDTGMSRFGFTVDEVHDVVGALAQLSWVKPVLLSSHLATADDPQEIEYTKRQQSLFNEVFAVLCASGFSMRRCLANSGAIFAHPNCGYDLQRPGVVLYGGNPFVSTSWEGLGQNLVPVMEVRSKVLEIRTLSVGQTLGYGRSFCAQRQSRIGLVGIGYADNYARGLSNASWMFLHGRRVPVVGRVCMEVTLVDLSDVPQARPGDEIYILGGSGPEAIKADDLARWWGTISYEVFCLLGQNKRHYSQM